MSESDRSLKEGKPSNTIRGSSRTSCRGTEHNENYTDHAEPFNNLRITSSLLRLSLLLCNLCLTMRKPSSCNQEIHSAMTSRSTPNAIVFKVTSALRYD